MSSCFPGEREKRRKDLDKNDNKKKTAHNSVPTATFAQAQQAIALR